MQPSSYRCISTATADGRGGKAPAAVTIFVCANCARPAQAPTSAGRPRPTVPDFSWPWPVREILVPCTGRLQPEHILKAFESGAGLVCAVACGEDNCHHLEGSKRCARRVDYLRSILREIGLGGERLMLFNLPGTAAEDMALAAGRPAHAREDLDAQLAAVRDHVMRALEDLPPNPLHKAPTDEAIVNSSQEDDNDED
ncbi:MAG: hydrogenase iron-sulfur subunit [Bryobacterales bacterium]|nr:hydrogenase iron-sulfur subunit [Bryobacterales bacterium]